MGGEEEVPGWCVVHLCEECEDGEECVMWGWPIVWCAVWVRSVMGVAKGKCGNGCQFYHPAAQRVKDEMQIINQARSIAATIRTSTPDIPTIQRFLTDHHTAYPLLHALVPNTLPAIIKQTTFTPPDTPPLPQDTCPAFLVAMPCKCASHPPVPKHLLPTCRTDIRWHDASTCPYPHIMLPPNALTCKKFQKGVCPDRLMCTKIHSYV
eukprot:TRINITY_DN17216_c0_g1_i1.p1 TRINITY_DN17216_c0_g1~~TRINITY_DN17216_c0_g1_i1.p1  ORF type:complete len:232 (+),score=40.65 TRINITY_DN17216_c0_g1_i1:75-698(+)